jgi:hypothetical protein
MYYDLATGLGWVEGSGIIISKNIFNSPVESNKHKALANMKR